MSWRRVDYPFDMNGKPSSAGFSGLDEVDINGVRAVWPKSEHIIVFIDGPDMILAVNKFGGGSVVVFEKEVP